MLSLTHTIYEDTDVIFTLAWLLNIKTDHSPKRIISRAVQSGLINIDKGNSWHANEKDVVRRINNPKVAFPHFNDTQKILSILIGIGEIAARSHGDYKNVVSRKFSSFFYKKSLLNVMNEILKDNEYLVRKRSIDEIGYAQSIANIKFNWSGYNFALNVLNRGDRLGDYSYGLSFILSILLKVIPHRFSFFIEKYKSKEFVGELCRPVIEPLMFKNLDYVVPLLNSNNIYLKLLASASVVHQDLFESYTTIENNLNLLTKNGINIGDAIWITSIKLRDQYLTVARLDNQIVSLDREIRQLEKSLGDLAGVIIPNSNVELKINRKKDVLSSLEAAEVLLESSIDELVKAWPKAGIEMDKIENFIQLIGDNGLSRGFPERIPSINNRIQILSHNLNRIEDWIGISSKNPLDSCDELIHYSSDVDLKKVKDAAKALVLLADDKNKNLGRLLGMTVMKFDKEIEFFITRPFMSVRKPNVWGAAVSRLAVVHLLALYVFDQVAIEKENEVSPVALAVIDKVNLLLKVSSGQSYFGGEELFSDLKNTATHLISSKDYLKCKSIDIANDKDLPYDYRVRIIFASQVLSFSHWKLAIGLFESFSKPTLIYGKEDKHFSEWICLLDLCVAYCWKFNRKEAIAEIIHLWERYCPMYGKAYAEYQVYARKLYTALLSEGIERDWLMDLDGFSQSYCMVVFNET
jgi:hypothetical protein